MAQPNAVHQVPECASKLQSEAEPQQSRGIPLRAVQEDQDRYTDERDQDQWRILPLEQAKDAACVEGMRDSEEAFPGEGLVQQQQFPDQVFGKLVRQEYEDCELD